MSTLLLTGFDDNMVDVGAITAPLMLKYAAKNGYDFKVIRSYEEETHPSWQKGQAVYRALTSGYQTVIWLDADTLITNMDAVPLIISPKPLHASQDWGLDAEGACHFSMGNFIANRDREGDWWSLWEGLRAKVHKWGNEPLWEQSAMREIYQEHPDASRMFWIHPRREMNAVHADLAQEAPEPWQPGDWLCHLTGVEITNEKRVETANKLKEELGL